MSRELYEKRKEQCPLKNSKLVFSIAYVEKKIDVEENRPMF